MKNCTQKYIYCPRILRGAPFDYLKIHLPVLLLQFKLSPRERAMYYQKLVKDLTFQEIGKNFHITKERAKQIICKINVRLEQADWIRYKKRIKK